MKKSQLHKKGGVYYGWWVVLSSFIITAISLGGSYIFGLFFQPWQDEFGWSRAEISWAYSLNLLVYGLSGLVIGWLIDKYSARMIVIVGGVLSALGLFLASRVESLPQLYLAWGVILALGMSTCWYPLVAAVARWFPARKGVPLGILAAGTGVGTILIPPFVERIIATHDWHLGMVAYGVLCLLGIVIPGLVLKNQPRNHEEATVSGAVSTEPAAADTGLAGILRDPNLPLLMTGQFLCSCILRLVMAHLVPHAMDIGASSQVAAVVVSVVGVLSVTGRLVMGAAQDKIGARRAFVICLTVQAFSLLLLVFSSNLAVLYVFAVVFGFTYGGDIPQLAALMVDCFGMRRMGRIMGIMAVAAGTGGFTGPLLGGYAFDILGSYKAAFALGAVGAGVAAVAVYRLKVPGRSRT